MRIDDPVPDHRVQDVEHTFDGIIYSAVAIIWGGQEWEMVLGIVLLVAGAIYILLAVIED